MVSELSTDSEYTDRRTSRRRSLQRLSNGVAKMVGSIGSTKIAPLQRILQSITTQKKENEIQSHKDEVIVPAVHAEKEGMFSPSFTRMASGIACRTIEQVKDLFGKSHKIAAEREKDFATANNKSFAEVREQKFAEVREQKFAKVREQKFAEVREQKFAEVREQKFAEVREMVLNRVRAEEFAKQEFAEARWKKNAEKRLEKFACVPNDAKNGRRHINVHCEKKCAKCTRHKKRRVKKPPWKMKNNTQNGAASRQFAPRHREKFIGKIFFQDLGTRN